MYHPWRDLRDREWLTLRFDSLTGKTGCIRGETITIDDGLLQAQRRCTLAHELVHDERRIHPTHPALIAREERTVERIAARRLIELERLVEVLRWTRSTEEAADELWVDVPMLVALVASLSDAERAWIDSELAE